MHSSYLYHFDTNNWNAVYKHRVGKDYKFKAGYDSDVRLGWASLWDEQMTFIPSISLPSNAISCAFKRRFSPSDKMRHSFLYS
ncbi:hypothetical protein ACS0TY_004791 [Phlomoides rotata]